MADFMGKFGRNRGGTSSGLEITIVRATSLAVTQTGETFIKLDLLHVTNFIESVRNGAPPNCPATEGHKSVALLHLGNIAWRVGRELNCDTTNGHILNDKAAMKLWRREYAPGWEPKV